jgi:hypothetical protein
LHPVTQLMSCNWLGKLHERSTTRICNSSMMATFAVSRLFGEHIPQFLVAYVDSENIGKTSNSVLD